MAVRNAFGVLLSVKLLLLAARSGLALEPQPPRPREAAGAEAAPGAHAPWFIETVDSTGDVGQYASVSIDPFGRAFVSYYDATNQQLRMAYDVGAQWGDSERWNTFTLDSAADVGKYSSIAYDRHFYWVGVAYHDATNAALKLVQYKPFSVPWFKDTIDKGIPPVSSTGLYTSLEYDSGGTAYIAYYFDNPGNVDGLMIASQVESDGNCGYGYDAGRWQCDTIHVGEGVGQYAALELDSDGHRHVAYYDGGSGDLWYATSATGSNCGPGNSWTCYPVSSAADVGQYASLYLDSEAHYHIAYYDAISHTLRYAVEVDSGGNCGVLGSAQCDEIDAMMQGYNPLGLSIAEDPAGYPVIAYQSRYGSLKLARPLAALGLPAGSGNCGPETPFSSWYCETIDPAGTWIPYRNGDYVSIDVSPSGLATIAYYGFITPEGGNLMVAYQRFQVFLPLVLKN
jgi:hypothetical protein